MTVIATGSTLKGVKLQNVQGFRWQGGQIESTGGFTGYAGAGYAVEIRESRNIHFSHARLTRAWRALVAADSQDLTFDSLTMEGLRSEGFNLAGTHRVLIRNARIRDFSPVPKSCTAPDGSVTYGVSQWNCPAPSVWKDGDHADGIQIWSSRKSHSSDITVTGSDVDGNMQGIGTQGPSTDRASRIKVIGNTVRVWAFHGITLEHCTDCVITKNLVENISTLNRTAVIRTPHSTGTFCGNTVPDKPATHPTNMPCPTGSIGQQLASVRPQAR